jgi:hypothetical protein
MKPLAQRASCARRCANKAATRDPLILPQSYQHLIKFRTNFVFFFENRNYFPPCEVGKWFPTNPQERKKLK